MTEPKEHPGTTTYRLLVSYDGAPFAGWQRQPASSTVQATLEDALSDLLGFDITVVGSGRTDTGVHAREQAAHLRLERRFPVKGLVHGCNERLPRSVRVMAAHLVADGFHAQKSAASKEYRYYLSRARVLSPLYASSTVSTRGPFDLEAVEAATRALVGEHDFTAFAKSGGSHSSPVRRILEAEWFEQEDDRLFFRVVGNGFLRGMVRAMVGTLIEVGRGQRPVSDIARLLDPSTTAERSDAGPNAPARGLLLYRVSYPDWPALEAWPEAPVG